jgi:hypothetical protein
MRALTRSDPGEEDIVGVTFLVQRLNPVPRDEKACAH